VIVRITIVICTWNRARLLGGTLGSLRRCSTPRGWEWSVLVVDNGSPDGTRNVVAEHRDGLRIRLVTEPSPGLSRARNRALLELLGEAGSRRAPHYVVWIDDDVLVEPTWLEKYGEAFRAWPDATVFGGPVIPDLLGDPPRWLLESLSLVSHAFAALDLGEESVPLGPGIDRLPYGCNFAVRGDALQGRRFDERLGRTRGKLGRGGEEIGFVQSILADGACGRWVPGAAVRHCMGPERQTEAYLRSYSRWDGFDAGLRERSERTAPSRSRLRILWLAAELRYVLRRPWARPRVWVSDLLAAGRARGRLMASTRPAGS
jgi:glycosyltransferase involved in cell wall biosynthesis